MNKLDYLENKINEILSEISFLSDRCETIEKVLNIETNTDSNN